METKEIDGELRQFMSRDEASAMRKTNITRSHQAIEDATVKVSSNRLVVQFPISIRVWHWLVAATLSPKPISRFRTWLVYTPVRTMSFLLAVFGPKVDDKTFRERMETCRKCNDAQISLVRKKTASRMYCTNCQCPKWPLSDLSRKNRMQNWGCPARKFAGRPEPEAWKSVREQERQNLIDMAKDQLAARQRSLNVVES